MIAGSTPAARLYDVDCDLRPEGKNGPLSRGVDSYVIYWREHALTWERQAMTRARVVAGDAVLGDELLDEIAPWVWGPGLSAEGIRDIRRMKARIEAERIPMGEDPDFHLKLGRGSLSDMTSRPPGQLMDSGHWLKAMVSTPRTQPSSPRPTSSVNACVIAGSW